MLKGANVDGIMIELILLFIFLFVNIQFPNKKNEDTISNGLSKHDATVVLQVLKFTFILRSLWILRKFHIWLNQTIDCA